jgi:hypothetical protein
MHDDSTNRKMKLDLFNTIPIGKAAWKLNAVSNNLLAGEVNNGYDRDDGEEVRIWDINSGKCIWNMPKMQYHDFAAFPNNQFVTSWHGDIRLWNLETKQPLREIKKLGWTLANGGNTQVFSASEGKINSWDIRTGAFQSLMDFNFQQGSGHTRKLINLDNNQLVNVEKGYVYLLDLRMRKCLKSSQESIDEIIALPNRRLAWRTNAWKNPIGFTFWDIDEWRSITRIARSANEDFSNFILFSNNKLGCLTDDNKISMWNEKSFQWETQFKFPTTTHRMILLPDKVRLVTAIEEKSISLKIWKLSEETSNYQSSLIKSVIPSQNYEISSAQIKVDNRGDIKLSIAIPYHQLTFGKELGRGGFGIVYEGQYQFGQVAIKTLLHQDLKNSLIEDFKKEASMMASLRSPFIVSLYGVCLEKPHYSIVMEYMANGSLSNLLQNEKPIEWKIRYQIGLDVGGGLAYLHNYQMVHCDLKSLNILLDINHRAKISDFGLSKVKLETSFSTVAGGSTRWMAPELFDEGAKSTKAADVFAYGLVLWELGARKFPFATTRNEAVPMLVCRGKREEITKDTPPSMAKLIAKCWDGRAEVRPPMDEAVKTLQAEQASYKF